MTSMIFTRIREELVNLSIKFFGKFGLFLIPVTTFNHLNSSIQASSRAALEMKLLNYIAQENQGLTNLEALKLVTRSQSQLGQDIFALANSGFKRKGFFVEFGATDGISLSNTWMLETDFEWNGILAEPARKWQAALTSNRKSIVSQLCVWSETGKEIEFSEASDAELSTISKFRNSDLHSVARKNSSSYKVETISLMDLLKENKAPRVIDYLSIDTEGSELEILSSFDFSSYDVRIITVEHNHTKNRHKINKLLEANGFRRVLESMSDFDDWYLSTK